MNASTSSSSRAATRAMKSAIHRLRRRTRITICTLDAQARRLHQNLGLHAPATTTTTMRPMSRAPHRHRGRQEAVAAAAAAAATQVRLLSTTNHHNTVTPLLTHTPLNTHFRRLLTMPQRTQTCLQDGEGGEGHQHTPVRPIPRRARKLRPLRRRACIPPHSPRSLRPLRQRLQARSSSVCLHHLHQHRRPLRLAPPHRVATCPDSSPITRGDVQ